MKAVAARRGHTSVRIMDAVYVEIYSDAARGLADAIDRLAEDASAAGPRRDDQRRRPDLFPLVVPTGFEPVSPP